MAIPISDINLPVGKDLEVEVKDGQRTVFGFYQDNLVLVSNDPALNQHICQRLREALDYLKQWEASQQCIPSTE